MSVSTVNFVVIHLLNVKDLLDVIWPSANFKSQKNSQPEGYSKVEWALQKESLLIMFILTHQPHIRAHTHTRTHSWAHTPLLAELE